MNLKVSYFDGTGLREEEIELPENFLSLIIKPNNGSRLKITEGDYKGLMIRSDLSLAIIPSAANAIRITGE